MLMYFFIRNTCCMVAKPVKCHIDCCNYFSHIFKFMSIQIRVSFLQLPLTYRKVSEKPPYNLQFTESKLSACIGDVSSTHKYTHPFAPKGFNLQCNMLQTI